MCRSIDATRDLAEENRLLRKQRDKLLEALKAALEWRCGCYAVADPLWHSERCWVSVARAAIEQVEKEQA